MKWSDWIIHNGEGFPSDVLRPGMFVELRLYGCGNVPKGKAMFRVGHDEITSERDDLKFGEPYGKALWLHRPNLLRCFAVGGCVPSVREYRHSLPPAEHRTSSVWSSREAE